MVVPLVEALLLGVLRRRATRVPAPRPTRLVSTCHDLDSLGVVAPRTSVLLHRTGAAVEVLPAGSPVLPSLRGRPGAYVVVSHEPVDVTLRAGPFETFDERTVQQVELRLTVALVSSPALLAELVDHSAPADASPPLDVLDDLGERVLDRLGREVATRTADALHRRTLARLMDTSLGVLLDQTLPTTFLGGVLSRSAVEVVDVDWPTEGRGCPPCLGPVPGGALGPPGAAGP